jgi:hypothetical protein
VAGKGSGVSPIGEAIQERDQNRLKCGRMTSESTKYAIISGLFAAVFIALIIAACICPPLAAAFASAAAFVGISSTGLMVGVGVGLGLCAAYFTHNCASHIFRAIGSHYKIKGKTKHSEGCEIAFQILNPLIFCKSKKKKIGN